MINTLNQAYPVVGSTVVVQYNGKEYIGIVEPFKQGPSGIILTLKIDGKGYRSLTWDKIEKIELSKELF